MSDFQDFPEFQYNITSGQGIKTKLGIASRRWSGAKARMCEANLQLPWPQLQYYLVSYYYYYFTHVFAKYASLS